MKKTGTVAGTIFKKAPAVILTAGLLGCSLLPYLGGATYDASTPALLLEFFAHFRAQYLFIALGLGVLALFVRSRSALVLALIAAAINLAHIAPGYLPGAPAKAASDDRNAAGGTTRLRVLHANVLRGNRRYAKLLEVIRARDPDVIFLQEYDRPWFRAVHEQLAAYPYHKYHLMAYYGIGVYSRVKPESVSIITPGRAGVPSLHLHMRTRSGRIYHLLSSHPPPPIGLRNTRNRNHQLEELAHYARSLKGPVMFAGDLNVSNWSPAFRRFLKESGLREAPGRGIGATWPTNMPWAMIPIDHCLASKGVRVAEMIVLENTGSDHRPLLCSIAIM